MPNTIVNFAATFSGSDLAAGWAFVDRPAHVFTAGNYPDKAFEITEEELAQAAAEFSPVPVDLQHTPTVLDGALGQLVSVSAAGKALFGTVRLPRWLAAVLPANASLSAAWNRATKRLVGLSIVTESRIPDAQLLAAFAAGTGQGKGATTFQAIGLAAANPHTQPALFVKQRAAKLAQGGMIAKFAYQEAVRALADAWEDRAWAFLQDPDWFAKLVPAQFADDGGHWVHIHGHSVYIHDKPIGAGHIDAAAKQFNLTSKAKKLLKEAHAAGTVTSDKHLFHAIAIAKAHQAHAVASGKDKDGKDVADKEVYVTTIGQALKHGADIGQVKANAAGHPDAKMQAHAAGLLPHLDDMLAKGAEHGKAQGETPKDNPPQGADTEGDKAGQTTGDGTPVWVPAPTGDDASAFDATAGTFSSEFASAFMGAINAGHLTLDEVQSVADKAKAEGWTVGQAKQELADAIAAKQASASSPAAPAAEDHQAKIAGLYNDGHITSTEKAILSGLAGTDSQGVGDWADAIASGGEFWEHAGAQEPTSTGKMALAAAISDGKITSVKVLMAVMEQADNISGGGAAAKDVEWAVGLMAPSVPAGGSGASAAPAGDLHAALAGHPLYGSMSTAAKDAVTDEIAHGGIADAAHLDSVLKAAHANSAGTIYASNIHEAFAGNGQAGAAKGADLHALKSVPAGGAAPAETAPPTGDDAPVKGDNGTLTMDAVGIPLMAKSLGEIDAKQFSAILADAASGKHATLGHVKAAVEAAKQALAPAPPPFHAEAEQFLGMMKPHGIGPKSHEAILDAVKAGKIADKSQLWNLLAHSLKPGYTLSAALHQATEAGTLDLAAPVSQDGLLAVVDKFNGFTDAAKAHVRTAVENGTLSTSEQVLGAMFHAYGLKNKAGKPKTLLSHAKDAVKAAAAGTADPSYPFGPEAALKAASYDGGISGPAAYAIKHLAEVGKIGSWDEHAAVIAKAKELGGSDVTLQHVQQAHAALEAEKAGKAGPSSAEALLATAGTLKDAGTLSTAGHNALTAAIYDGKIATAADLHSVVAEAQAKVGGGTVLGDHMLGALGKHYAVAPAPASDPMAALLAHVDGTGTITEQAKNVLKAHIGEGKIPSLAHLEAVLKQANLFAGGGGAKTYVPDVTLALADLDEGTLQVESSAPAAAAPAASAAAPAAPASDPKVALYDHADSLDDSAGGTITYSAKNALKGHIASGKIPDLAHLEAVAKKAMEYAGGGTLSKAYLEDVNHAMGDLADGTLQVTPAAPAPAAGPSPAVPAPAPVLPHAGAHHVSIGTEKVELNDSPVNAAHAVEAANKFPMSAAGAEALKNLVEGGEIKTHSQLHQALAIAKASSTSYGASKITGHSFTHASLYGHSVEAMKKAAEEGDSHAEAMVAAMGDTSFKSPSEHAAEAAHAFQAGHVDGAAMFHKQVGSQKGGNPGGTYETPSGEQHYIKQYDKPERAHEEHLANAIYNALGISAPVSTVFQHNGETHYASKIIPNQGTIKHTGVTKTMAQQVAKGFAADVLLGNWDVLGTGTTDYDNVILGEDGKVHRIDNGGALLHRALGSPKSQGQLDTIAEWDGYFNPGVNKQYAQVMKKAGIGKAEDVPDLLAQIGAIESLQKQHGGWAGFIAHAAPQLSTEHRAKVAAVLEKRTSLLQAKRAEMLGPIEAVKAQYKAHTSNQAGKAWVDKHLGPQKVAATHAEAKAATWWYGGNWKHTNEALFDDAEHTIAPSDMAHVKTLDKFYAKETSKAKENVIIHRGFGLNEPDEVELKKQYENFKPGDIAHVKGYQAASYGTGPGYQSSHGFVWHIHVPAGVGLAHVDGLRGAHNLGSAAGEREILVNRGTTFRVLSSQYKDGAWHQDLEIVP